MQQKRGILECYPLEQKNNLEENYNNTEVEVIVFMFVFNTNTRSSYNYKSHHVENLLINLQDGGEFHLSKEI